VIIRRVIIEKMQRPSDKKIPRNNGGFYFVKVPEQLGRNPAQIILLSAGLKFGLERWQLETKKSRKVSAALKRACKGECA
jgi:hypothetical protein